MVCRNSRGGFTLMELLTVIAIAGLIIAVAVPSWLSLRRRVAVRAAAAEIRSTFHLTRSRAISRACNAAIRFTSTPGGWRYATYDDGDGDGVRSDDIRNGIDPLATPPRPFLQHSPLARVGLLGRVIRDPDGDPLRPTDSPVQFGKSSMCSFSALGSSTAGTIYITDDAGSLYAVRVYGATAKIRLIRYDDATRRWENR